MINKDAIGGAVDEDPSSIKGHMYIPRVTPKRQPGAILSWGLPANRE